MLPDGGRVRFDRISAGTSYTNAVYQNTTNPGPFYGAKIAWNGNGWTLTEKNGTVLIVPESFAASPPQQAALITIRDRNGNTVTLTRDPSPGYKLTRVTSPNGRYINFTYDTDNRITQAQDNIGRTVQYVYDGPGLTGRLSQVTDANLGVWQYGYNASNQTTTIRDARNILYLRAGEYAKAENAYRKVLDIENTKPAQDQIVSGVLNFLAGLLLDQGRYKEADALYRQALQAVLNHPLIDPTTRDDICLNWASLRRDIGRTSEAVALEGWSRGTSNSPPPFPADLVVPALVQLNGLTPNQFRRRLRQPYDNDFTALWNELGLAPWGTCQWPQCVEQNWDVDLVAGNTGVLERVHVANGINGPTRFLLFEPTNHESNGVQQWKVYGILDLPYGDRQGTARIEKSGDKRWLVLEAGIDAGSSRSYVETWYDLAGGKFQPVAGYPAGAPSLQSVITDLTRKLHSENWMEREEAVQRIAAIPDATKSSTVVQELVDLLDRENRLIRNLFKQGTGVSAKYGEGFGEYVSYILDILMKSGNLRDTRTLEVLAYSSYNPDSGFAMNLADNGGAILVPIALELIKSDEAVKAIETIRQRK